MYIYILFIISGKLICRVKQILDLNPVFLSLWIHRYSDIWWSAVSAMLVEIGWLHLVSGYDWVENLCFFSVFYGHHFFEKHQTHALSFLFLFFFFRKLPQFSPWDVWVFLRPALQPAGGGFSHRWIWDTAPTARSEVPNPEGPAQRKVGGWGRDTHNMMMQKALQVEFTHIFSIHL